jgi:hypothetical protein
MHIEIKVDPGDKRERVYEKAQNLSNYLTIGIDFVFQGDRYCCSPGMSAPLRDAPPPLKLFKVKWAVGPGVCIVVKVPARDKDEALSTAVAKVQTDTPQAIINVITCARVMAEITEVAE